MNPKELRCSDSQGEKMNIREGNRIPEKGKRVRLTEKGMISDNPKGVKKQRLSLEYLYLFSA